MQNNNNKYITNDFKWLNKFVARFTTDFVRKLPKNVIVGISQKMRERDLSDSMQEVRRGVDDCVK